MCFRLQAYPRPHLISYKIQQNGRQWAVVVPLSELSTFLAQGSEMVHTDLSSDNTDQCVRSNP